MTDNNNLQQFLDQMSSYSDEAAGGNNASATPMAIPAIGRVVEIAGSGSRVTMHAEMALAIASCGLPGSGGV